LQAESLHLSPTTTTTTTITTSKISPRHLKKKTFLACYLYQCYNVITKVMRELVELI
jgi:hypothetical protein